MNEDTQKQLVEWAKTAAEKGGAWLEQELPQFAAEIVAWHFWSSMFLIAFFVTLGLVVMAIAAVGLRWSLKHESSNDPTVGCACCIALLVAPIVTSVSVGINGYEAVKAAVAPRVVILEYVRGAVR